VSIDVAGGAPYFILAIDLWLRSTEMGKCRSVFLVLSSLDIPNNVDR
jgi:hypothetical protein